MIVLSVTNYKGGTGKTLISLILTQCLKEKGYRVCYLDLCLNRQGELYLKNRKDEYGLPAPWDYYSAANARETADIIDKLEAQDIYDFMIVDASGPQSHLTLDLFARTDLTLIAVTDNISSRDLALLTQETLLREQSRLGRALHHAFIFTDIELDNNNETCRNIKRQTAMSNASYVKQVLPYRPFYRDLFQGLVFAEMNAEYDGERLYPSAEVKDVHDEAVRFVTQIMNMAVEKNQIALPNIQNNPNEASLTQTKIVQLKHGRL
ncbi:ParA family protein [Hellea sp.]|nr:ParA family protein [Hellea sp.]